MQALEAAGADQNVIYLSVPITSGERELRLLDELLLRSADDFHRHHLDRWKREVIEPNETAATCHAAAVRAAPWASSQVVIDPSRMHVPGWDQADYNGFWIDLMERHVRRVVATPGWAFSRGARVEVAFALALSLGVVDVTGTPLSREQLRNQAGAAFAELVRRGWTTAQIKAYLPTFDENVQPRLQPSAQTEVFNWLAEERTRQVSLFGPDADDERTRGGAFDPSGRWKSRLQQYWSDAAERGLEDPEGRLALAKFVATACGLLESAVRVHGSLPSEIQIESADG